MKEQYFNFFHRYPQPGFDQQFTDQYCDCRFGCSTQLFCYSSQYFIFWFLARHAVSFSGEAFGAVVAFYLYRKGFKKILQGSLEIIQKHQQLINAEGKKASG